MTLQSLLLVVPLLASAQEPALFRDISYESALAAAKKEEKIVMIDFFTTWCGPCKKLDAVTWKDPAVLKWAEKSCIALKIDAEKHVNLAKGHQVSAYPTIVLLQADGKEIDRMIGYRDAQRFLSEVESALAGKTSLDRARAELAGNEQDPMVRKKYAQELARRGELEAALEEYLWCFDRGIEHPGFGGVRRSFLLGDIERLGQRHPPALKALQERRDRSAARLRNGSRSYDDLADVAAIDRTLKKQSETIALYDELRKETPLTPELRFAVQRQLLHPLADAKRYADLIELVDDPDAYVARQIENIQRSTSERGTGDDEKIDDSSRSVLNGLVVLDCAVVYESLLAMQRSDDASVLANRLIAFEPTESTYVSLMRSAVRAGSIEIAKALGERGTAALAGADNAKLKQQIEKLPKTK